MRRKFLATFLSLTLIVTLSACGSSTDSTVNSDISTNEAILQCDTAEAENTAVHTPQEQETWPDDTVITFTDDYMLKEIRQITGITSGDITYGDVREITSLDWDISEDLEPLKYFTSLTTLDISRVDAENLDAISNLVHLTKLRIGYWDNLTDISVLNNFANLTYLKIDHCETLSDISTLSNLTSLTELDIAVCDGITDISPLKNLTYLSILEITGCDKLVDISAIGNLKNLTSLKIKTNELNEDNEITLENLQNFL